jgi:hypothetical protein
MSEAADIFSGVAPIAGGYFGAPPAFLVDNAVSVVNGWQVSRLDCGAPDYPPSGGSGRCWTANPFPSTGAFPGALLHIHGTEDTEEPFELCVTQWR